MREADLARRIYDNLRWSLIVNSGAPISQGIPGLDTWAQLQALWRRPNAEFVSGLFLLLLARPVDRRAFAKYRLALTLGLQRAELVHSIATSKEARLGELDVSWLSRLQALPAPLRRPFSVGAVKSLLFQALRRLKRLCTRSETAPSTLLTTRSSSMGAGKEGS
jgi:hypothetical protein